MCHAIQVRQTNDFHYAPFWCEENAVLLAKSLGLTGLSVVFITNPERMTAFARQRAGDGELGLAIWDYHVVVVDRRDETRPRVWDPDCTLGLPVAFETWIEGTFDVLGELVEALPPFFRVVDAETCVELFVSDRSHMRHGTDTCDFKGPPWEPIGRGESTLARFLSLEEPFVGELYDLTAFVAWVTRVG